LRAAQGLESIDFFVTGYWVWAKLIESLAEIGYDSNTLVIERKRSCVCMTSNFKALDVLNVLSSIHQG
jgi:hypothetical protein